MCAPIIRGCARPSWVSAATRYANVCARPRSASRSSPAARSISPGRAAPAMRSSRSSAMPSAARPAHRVPCGPLDRAFERDLDALRCRGHRLLPAHPERSADLRADPKRLQRLVDDGVLVSSPSALLPADDFAVALMRDGLAHVLASDAHAATGPAPDLAGGMEAAHAIVSRRAHWMAAEAPAAVLAGTHLPAAPSDDAQRHGALPVTDVRAGSALGRLSRVDASWWAVRPA